MTVIKIIVGSTRPQRFGIQVGRWLESVGKDAAAASAEPVRFEFVDLADVNLPMYDEPFPAAMNKYQNDHTKKWSAVVAEADGYLMITPEYNNSFNAALKNAIDYLYYEWNFKPVAFASYGSAAGGTRAVAHLRDVAGELKLYDIRESVVISNYWNQLGAEGTFAPTEDQIKSAKAVMEQLVFWALEMKAPRAKLAAQ